MNQAFATVIFGLAASLFWGSGDFSGGLASRRSNASSVVVFAYIIGFTLLALLALIWREPWPSFVDILWGALAGIAGVVGLMSFYSALSIGRMGIVAPVSAVLTASLPVFFSMFLLSAPAFIQIIGFVLAVLAIVLISRPERTHGRPKGLGLAMLAGLGFGCFFILISRVSVTSVFWPLVIARLVSVLAMLGTMLLRRQTILPKKDALLLIVLAGVLDAIGNVFFVLASHTGRLDVAAVLSSLYPAATVLLAAIILRERMTGIQRIGVFLALIAVPLISA